MGKWIKSGTPGIRYREHSKNKHSGKPDRYWAIYFRQDGKLSEQGLGWSSDGWNLTKAQMALLEFKTNAKKGEGPTSFKEKRAIEEERKKAEFARQEEENRRLEMEKKESVLFGELIDSYIEWVKKNKRSARMDESRCRIHLKPDMGQLKAREINVSTLHEFKETLVDKKLSQATIRHCMVLVRQIFNHHIAMGNYPGINPIAKQNIPRSLKEKLIPNKLDNQRLRFLSSEQAALLLEDLKKRSLTTYGISLISLRTGGRFDEIVSLKWQDVDFFNGWLHLFGKDGTTRQAFMTPDVKEFLLSIGPGKPDKLVFKSTKGDKIKQISWAFWRAVNKLGFNAGVTDPKQRIVFHSLRHTFASWLAQQGTSLFEIKELMGHQKIEMTMRYSHLLPDTKKKAVMQMYNETASENVIRLSDHRE